MKVYIKPTTSGNVISTVAIGQNYLDSWEKNALPGWAEYCLKYGLGLIVFHEDMLDKDSNIWKKANWQKLLIGTAIRDSKINVKNVCYLDTDILISPLAPNVFEGYDEATISLVSQINGLPQPLQKTLRRLAFLRHTHWDKRYPLDSALFMSPKQIFEFHNLPAHDDYVCTGFFVFNVDNHAGLLKSWFDKYQRGITSLTGGGEEPHLNHELFNWGRLSWLPYEFQALWTYEVAWRYPFLFDLGMNDETLVRECIEASLYANYFLHFAGSWNECQMWQIGSFFSDSSKKKELEAYADYLKLPVTGSPKGIIRP